MAWLVLLVGFTWLRQCGWNRTGLTGQTLVLYAFMSFGINSNRAIAPEVAWPLAMAATLLMFIVILEGTAK